MADWRPRTLVLAAVLLVGLGLGAGLIALLDDDSGGDEARTAPNTVDIGFSQDMSAHHHQGIELAQAMVGTEDPILRSLAFGMASAQLQELGRMQGFLELWDAPTLPADGPMRWMQPDPAGHTHTSAPTPHQMPGMASPAQLQLLHSATGADRDILFLQLMIRHHQGALQMSDYAVRHAAAPQILALATRIGFDQSQEINRLAQMLAARGVDPGLPPPEG